MNSILKNTILSVCAVGLLAGCASKKVEYDESSKTQAQTETPSSSVDNRMESMAGEESAVSDEANYSNSNSRGLSTQTHDGVHSVQSDIDGNVVLLESVHFNFDKFNLTDEMREIATTNYTKIDATIQSYNGLKIKLEGNCDEWGTDEYNYALGLKRAKTAKDALVADGIDASRIMMVSFGESNPVCNQKNTSCWKMNRRVDYRLLP
jgi:peptidoglycan-associated lipoprotein